MYILTLKKKDPGYDSKNTSRFENSSMPVIIKPYNVNNSKR